MTNITNTVTLDDVYKYKLNKAKQGDRLMLTLLYSLIFMLVVGFSSGMINHSANANACPTTVTKSQ